MTQKYTDFTYLKEIADGSNEFMVEMIHSFLEEAPQTMSALQQFLSEKKWAELRGVAHKIKPAVDFMGMHDMKQVIRDIEKFAATQSNLEQLPALIEQFNSFCKNATLELKEEIKNYQ